MTIIIALISIACGSLAQLFLKKGIAHVNLDMQRGIPLIAVDCICNSNLWIGILLYGVSLLFWFYVLSKMELGRAYPMVSLGYVFTLLLGYFFLGEDITTYKVVGVLFIIVGVVFLAGVSK